MTTTEKPAEQLTEDPFWDIPVESNLNAADYEEIRAGGSSCGALNNRADDYEGERGDWTCTRSRHPDHWRHIALSGNYVLGKWGGDGTVTTETDPDPDMEVGKLEIGKLYKFRNRPTLLMVVGFRREDRVEVLDLTHQRFRVLTPVQLVPRRDDMVPTPEQLKWVGMFMAQQRVKTRQVAVAQRRDEFFKSMTELNSVLNELGLEPAKRRMEGQIQLTLQVRAEGFDSPAHVQTRFVDWLAQQVMPTGVTLTRTPTTRSVYTELRDRT